MPAALRGMQWPRRHLLTSNGRRGMEDYPPFAKINRLFGQPGRLPCAATKCLSGIFCPSTPLGFGRGTRQNSISPCKISNVPKHPALSLFVPNFSQEAFYKGGKEGMVPTGFAEKVPTCPVGLPALSTTRPLSAGHHRDAEGAALAPSQDMAHQHRAGSWC